MFLRNAFRLIAICVFTFSAATIHADIAVDVTYTNPAIYFGPVSFGLTELPDEVNASFLLSGNPVGSVTTYDLSDVIFFDLTFGDGAVSNLTSFAMEIDDGDINSLTYVSSPFDSPTVLGIVVLNFPLSISGTDIATGEAFSYSYANSSQTFAVVPEPSTLTLLSIFGLIGVAGRRHRR